jgi:hypothetical protein
MINSAKTGIVTQWRDMSWEEQEKEFERLNMAVEVKFNHRPGELEMWVTSGVFHEAQNKLIAGGYRHFIINVFDKANGWDAVISPLTMADMYLAEELDSVI